ncbi:hypothetical protein Enr10x_21110 [Gimesia panareensis]|uniref:Uncharacterized protein n=1 Tax=Gimesia panareensis TaxID=2527978 RepID=A0A517Q598_9PLAN|nr:hypothetical protein [Gimesia panareensis]QDT26801.1 hypothetical protein Enr10x_21110 [Gimesia panareensis]
MPDVTPTGPLSLPFEQAALILAACNTFQSVCGVASASLAREKIYYPYYDLGEKDNAWPIPGIIINDDDMNQQFMNRNLDQGGSLLVTFCFPVNENYVSENGEIEPENQILDFRNKLGAILNEMLALANTPNPDTNLCYLHVTRWEKWSTPVLLSSPHAAEEMMHAAFVLEWVA